MLRGTSSAQERRNAATAPKQESVRTRRRRVGASRLRSSAQAGPASARRSAPGRQFTGVVTALDKTSLTVEKGGKSPRSMVFTQNTEMRTVGGDLEKDSRVTVHYRAQGREFVAVRVVVKPAGGETAER